MYSMNTKDWSNQKEFSFLDGDALEHLIALAEKATPGPWVHEGCKYCGGVETAYEPKEPRTYGSSGNRHVCCLKDGEYYDWEDVEEQLATGEFIAHAHPGVVKYLANEVMRLRAELCRRGFTDVV